MTRILVFLVIALTSIGCKASNNPSEPSTSSTTTTIPPTSLVHVFGRVFDYRTTAGVPSARIAFYISGFDATAGTVVADPTGFYSISLPRGTYDPRIDGDSANNRIVPVGSQYLADYFVNGGMCILFYGNVRDASTGEPIVGATVTLITNTQTGSDGSFRLDFGCPVPNPNGFPPLGIGTTGFIVAKAGYATWQASPRRETLGGLNRVDVVLVRNN